MAKKHIPTLLGLLIVIANAATVMAQQQEKYDPRDDLKIAIAFGGNGLFSNGKTEAIFISGHYALNRWIGAGAAFGGFKHKYSVGCRDSVAYSKFYFEPSVNLRLPPIISFEKFPVSIIPVVQAGISFMARQTVEVPSDGQLIKYSTNPIGFNIRVGIYIPPAPIQIGYVFSTIDVNRTWDSTQRRFKSRPIHGVFIGIRVGI